MDKFHWAYIGCGGIAETTAKEILRSGEHEITAVWNRTRERAVVVGARGVIRIPRPHAARRARLGGACPEILRDNSALYARQFSNAAEEIRAGRKEGVKVPA